MIDNSRTISLHDQYLTASPYDDEGPDWAEPPYNVRCPKCNGDIFEEWGGDYPTYDFRCDDCGHEWNQNVEKPAMTDDQEKRIQELKSEVTKLRIGQKYKKGPPIDDFFESLDVEGDFHWDNQEAGDWHVYNCGEKDCPVQWHLMAFSEVFGRENGKRYVEIHDVDSDGNWDINHAYDERDGDTPEHWWEISDVMANMSDSFFLGWAEYWLDAATTGNDPCDQCIGTVKENWVDFCIKAVEDNIKYLKK
jgi:hypothetical protein